MGSKGSLSRLQTAAVPLVPADVVRWDDNRLAESDSEFGPQDHGVETWTFDIATQASSTAPTAGVINLCRVRTGRAATINNLAVHIATGGATIANAFLGLYDAAGNRLGQTATQATAWTTNGAKITPLTAGVAVTAATYYYVAILVGSATTMPLITRGSSSASCNFNLPAASYRFSTSGTGQTALPATIALGSTTIGSIAYFAALAV